ncbi:MAG TPA: tetratricopeptide repeat protein [Spirochaetota bacterium]|nr:tetratricopeptide repeat protein [Spirochaetota bacterium]HPV97121.1 tetratricopeptide repeat protein [Spirochaetota bacterium]
MSDRRNIQSRGVPACAALVFALAIGSQGIAPAGAAEKNAIYYNKHGWEFLEKGDRFRAILSFRNALKQNPRYREAMAGLGRAYLETEAYEESLKLFADVLNVDRDNHKAMTGMAFALMGLGRYDEALKIFEGVERVSEEDLEARFGTASIYYLMNKRSWALRKLEGILRVNPYHYRSLLLMADIKMDEGRPSEARGFVEKAMESDRELPDAYVKAGEIYYRNFLRTDDADYLAEAREEFGRALAIQPENYQANRAMGYVSLAGGRSDDALEYFRKSLAVFPHNPVTLYHVGLARELSGDILQAVDEYARALKYSPSDDVVQSKIEDVLALGDVKIGHPLRVGYANEHYARARKKSRDNLADEVMLHLRRALYLNPMHREAREALRDYYATLDYFEFYLDEQKALLRMYPGERLQDQLAAAVIKRRDRLYFKAGFYEEPPPRDVPGIVVLNLWPAAGIAAYHDAGAVLARYLSFALGQFGRQESVKPGKRLEIVKGMKDGEAFLGDNIEKLARVFKDEDPDRARIIVYGSYRDANGHLSANFKMMDLSRGVIIDEFDLAESGKDNLSRLALRAARRIYSAVPYRGRVLSVSDDAIVVNMGSFDGLAPGDLLVSYRYEKSFSANKIASRRKLVFAVAEADALVASAKPVVANDLRLIDEGEAVYPEKKRRARLLK